MRSILKMTPLARRMMNGEVWSLEEMRKLTLKDWEDITRHDLEKGQYTTDTVHKFMRYGKSKAARMYTASASLAQKKRLIVEFSAFNSYYFMQPKSGRLALLHRLPKNKLLRLARAYNISVPDTVSTRNELAAHMFAKIPNEMLRAVIGSFALSTMGAAALAAALIAHDKYTRK
jgi:hypothetical protein